MPIIADEPANTKKENIMKKLMLTMTLLLSPVAQADLNYDVLNYAVSQIEILARHDLNHQISIGSPESICFEIGIIYSKSSNISTEIYKEDVSDRDTAVVNAAKGVQSSLVKLSYFCRHERGILKASYNDLLEKIANYNYQAENI